MKDLFSLIWKCRAIIRKCIALSMIKFGFLDNIVLIKIDGGICSQMHQYLLGYYFQQKGYKVKFDLIWYKKWGKDMNGINVMNFDLLKLFPDLSFLEASSYERKWYQYFGVVGDGFDENPKFLWQKMTPPIYMNRYYGTNKEIDALIPKIFRYDENILDVGNQIVLSRIKSKSCSVAIHVRRGDLSSFLPAYGEPVSFGYFKRAINYLESQHQDCYFFIFSDEPHWCESVLIGEINLNGNYEIVNVNGTDKGYFDLILISFCNHVITSKGSLGKYGALLSRHQDCLVVLYDDNVERRMWNGKIPNMVFLQ